MVLINQVKLVSYKVEEQCNCLDDIVGAIAAFAAIELLKNTL